MRRTRFDNESCPIARTSDLLGDWWTPLLLREFFYGRHRFEEFTGALGISRPVLSARLKRFEAEGVIESREYQTNPPRREYRLTAKGRGLWDVVAAMWRFGEDWMFGETGPRASLVDTRTGDVIHPLMIDRTTGEPLSLEHTTVKFT